MKLKFSMWHCYYPAALLAGGHALKAQPLYKSVIVEYSSLKLPPPSYLRPPTFSFYTWWYQVTWLCIIYHPKGYPHSELSFSSPVTPCKLVQCVNNLHKELKQWIIGLSLVNLYGNQPFVEAMPLSYKDSLR